MNHETLAVAISEDSRTFCLDVCRARTVDPAHVSPPLVLPCGDPFGRHQTPHQWTSQTNGFLPTRLHAQRGEGVESPQIVSADSTQFNLRENVRDLPPTPPGRSR